MSDEIARWDTPGLFLDMPGLFFDSPPPVLLPPETSTPHHMMDLRKIFTNWFKDKEISFSELLKYAARHLTRMVANNPGALLNVRINATQTALIAVEAGVTDVATKAAIQKSKTETKDAFRKALPENIRKIHAAVVAAYGDPSADLTECFPEGRNVFNKCRDEELNNKLGQLVACLTPREAQVGTVHVSNAAGLLSTWTAIYAAQDVAMAQRAEMAGGRDAAKANLQLQLYLNVLALAAAFPDQPDKCDLYCPQQYLHNAEATDEDPPAPPPGP
jgi:hypothetical protein